MPADAVRCAACEADHPFIGSVIGVPLIECANAPDNGSYMMIDTLYLLNGGDRVLTGYDGHLWVRYAR